MHIDPKDFRVPDGKNVRLEKWPTDIGPLYNSDKQCKELLAGDVKELRALQRLLYASNGYAVLLIFQGMDAVRKGRRDQPPPDRHQPTGLRSPQLQASERGRIGA